MMIKRIFRNLYFLIFLNGFFLATLLHFRIEGNYERQLFRTIRADIISSVSPNDPQDSIVVKIMHACHDLLTNRETVFEGKHLTGFKANLLHSAAIDLMTANGACGSFSIVLARLFKGYKLPVRIAQMKANGVFAVHNIVEVKIGRKWVVLDPLFNIYFIKPDHKLASFADVKNNWEYYRKQVPAGYDTNYRYSGVRYSNWAKIPVILPTIKKILNFTIGEKRADTISLRTYFLRIYDIYFGATLVIFIIVLFFTLRRLVQVRLFPQKDTPFTFTNTFKYLRLWLQNRRTFRQCRI